MEHTGRCRILVGRDYWSVENTGRSPSIRCLCTRKPSGGGVIGEYVLVGSLRSVRLVHCRPLLVCCWSDASPLPVRCRSAASQLLARCQSPAALATRSLLVFPCAPGMDQLTQFTCATRVVLCPQCALCALSSIRAHCVRSLDVHVFSVHALGECSLVAFLLAPPLLVSRRGPWCPCAVADS